MSITSQQIVDEIGRRLPPYYTLADAKIEDGQKYGPEYPGLWFSFSFTYPGQKVRYCWITFKDDMTLDDLDAYANTAATQIKCRQQIDELEEKANALRKPL